MWMLRTLAHRRAKEKRLSSEKGFDMEQQETLTEAIKPYNPKAEGKREGGREEAVEGGAEGCVHIRTTLFPHHSGDSETSLSLSRSLRL